MYANIENDQLIFTQKFSSFDYFFFYASGDNNVVSLIQPTPDSEDTLEDYMPDEDVVDKMGYDIIEAMELKNGKIYDDSDSICGGGMKLIIKLTLCLMTLKKILEIIYLYICISEPTNGEKYLVKGDSIVYLSENG